MWVNWWTSSAGAGQIQGVPPGNSVNAEAGFITVIDSPTSLQRPYKFIQSSLIIFGLTGGNSFLI